MAHHWVGLALAVPLLIQAATGCFLAATPIFQDLQGHPALSGGEPRLASAALRAAAQPGLAPSGYHPGSAISPTLVDLATPGVRGAAVQVLLDPATLAVLGTRRPSQFYRWVHGLHENLLLPVVPGRSIVGWFGIGLLLLGLSGLVLWWPSPGRWAAALTVARRARGARLQREMHGAVGFWACAMLVVMSASGVTLAFPETLRAVAAVPSPPRPGPGLSRPARGEAEPLDIDAALARAGSAVPGAAIVDARLPTEPGRPVLVRLRLPGGIEGAPYAVASVDPAGSQVLSVQDPRGQNLVASALAWCRALHFGDAFGLAWRVMVLAAGIALLLLGITGPALWLLRRRNRQRLDERRRATLDSVTS